MRKIYCMRHGHSPWSLPDTQRSLSTDGIATVQRLAQHVADQALCQATKILHSPYNRTTQTAQLLHHVLHLPRQVSDLLTPSSNPNDLIKLLDAAQDDTLLVSHLPFLPSLIHALTGTHVHLEPAGLICLEGDPVWRVAWQLDAKQLP